MKTAATAEKTNRTETIQLEMQTLRANVSPQSFDDDRLSLSAVVGVDGFEFDRYTWSLGKIRMKLDFNTGLDVSRANDGAMPLLLDHEINIGIVEQLRLDGGNLIADVLFTKEDELAVRTYRRMKEGTIKKFSFGFNVGSLTLVKRDEENDLDTYAAGDISILEVTVTGMPQNPKTYVLGRNKAEENSFTCRIISNNGDSETMKVDAAPTPAQDKGKTIPVDTVLYLSKMKSQHNLSDDFYLELLSMENASKDEFSTKILEHLSNAQPRTPVTSGVQLVKDETDKIIPLITDSLVHQYCPQHPKLTQLATDNNFATFSFMDSARYILGRNGRDTLGMSNAQVYKLLQGREDFSTITNNFANRILLEGYSSEAKTYLPFTRVRDTNSFGQNISSRASRAPALKKVLNGRVQEGALGPDELETYRVYAYSVLMALTREALIDDDLGQFSNEVWAFGYQTNLLEADLVYAQILNNPVMADGKKLFSADHKNIGKSVALDENGLSEARAAIRAQVDGSGNRLNLIMRNIIVGSDLETTAEKYTYANVAPSNTADVNPFARTTQRIVDSVMDSNKGIWIATVANTQAAIVELAYLRGQRGPYIMSDSDIGVDGRYFRYGIDVGAKAVDWRGVWISSEPKPIADPAAEEAGAEPRGRRETRVRAAKDE
jgi:HK97 family phage prohead protease